MMTHSTLEDLSTFFIPGVAKLTSYPPFPLWGLFAKKGNSHFFLGQADYLAFPLLCADPFAEFFCFWALFSLSGLESEVFIFALKTPKIVSFAVGRKQRG